MHVKKPTTGYVNVFSQNVKNITTSGCPTPLQTTGISTVSQLTDYLQDTSSLFKAKLATGLLSANQLKSLSLIIFWKIFK